MKVGGFEREIYEYNSKTAEKTFPSQELRSSVGQNVMAHRALIAHENILCR